LNQDVHQFMMIKPKKELKELENGEAISLEDLKKDYRPIGLAKNRFHVPPAFFEELPEDMLDAFEVKELCNDLEMDQR